MIRSFGSHSVLLQIDRICYVADNVIRCENNQNLLMEVEWKVQPAVIMWATPGHAVNMPTKVKESFKFYNKRRDPSGSSLRTEVWCSIKKAIVTAPLQNNTKQLECDAIFTGVFQVWPCIFIDNKMDNLYITLLDPSGNLHREIDNAFKQYLPESVQQRFMVAQTTLQELKYPYDEFDCIVSPANSYGRLDGGYVILTSLWRPCLWLYVDSIGLYRKPSLLQAHSKSQRNLPRLLCTNSGRGTHPQGHAHLYLF